MTSIQRHLFVVFKSMRPHGRENREAIESMSKSREVDMPGTGGVAVLITVEVRVVLLDLGHELVRMADIRLDGRRV